MTITRDMAQRLLVFRLWSLGGELSIGTVSRYDLSCYDVIFEGAAHEGGSMPRFPA